MSPPQINLSLSPDLLRLRETGYNIQIRAGYLVIRDVPYVNSTRRICRGILVTALELAGDRTTEPTDHKIMFNGEFPCHADGKPMEMLRLNSHTAVLDEGLEIHHTFSRKPFQRNYKDYFEKVETYVSLIARDAAQIDPSASALTYQVVEPEEHDYPFNYLDTASARAEINVIAKKVAAENIAIVGLGGTGSYILDLVAKTPVKEIHVFDADTFSTHNAFRAPGAPSLEQLRGQPLKTRYFEAQYSKMNRRIKPHDVYIDASNVNLLSVATFLFLCVDRGPDKRVIVENLEKWGTPFVDVGIGLYRHGDSLGGKVRVSTSLPDRRDDARDTIPFGNLEADEYDKDIQIADLNALNACLAVIRWKKLRGFYLDFQEEMLTTYTIALNLLIGDDLSS
jgi:hypothetical protein